jgi:DNA polymerase-3 subunit gamma/tau
MPSMAYVSLYRKYRPQTFEEILGQQHVSQTLANAIAEGRVAHAYMFTGPRGTGKTSTARILAKALNCEQGPTPRPCGKCASCRAIADGSSLDVIEMDAASHSKVDETREILAGVPLATAGGRRKVYVIDEVHMLSAGSFNALLKTLEEPPSHVIFILATTEAHKVLQTIVSRTQRFDFRPVPVDVLETHLAEVAKSEGIDVDPDALGVVARHADGSVRDALSILDQLSSLPTGVSASDVAGLLGERGEDALVELFDAIAAADVGAVFWTVHSLVAEGADARQLAMRALEHARSLLLLRTAPDAEELLDVTQEDRAVLTTQSGKLSPPALLRAIELLAKAITEMRNAPNHRLLLEVALVRAAAPETDPGATGLLGRIERLERRLGIEAAAKEQGAQPARPAAASAKPSPRPRDERPAEAAPSRPRDERPAEATAPPAASEEPAPPAASEELAPPAAAPPERAPAEVGFGHVRDVWPATLREVNRLSKRVWGLLSPSRPLRFDDDRLVVEVQSPFHQSSMAEERNKEVLATALHAALGIRPSLTFAVRGSEPSEQPEGEEEAGSETTARDADTDPVELVKKGLGAEVVEEIAPGPEARSR